uniref:chitin synthase n=1 Tax=Echeneis naucrates TaxID=173247 RepID=A0A665U5Q2_ECHNA
LLLITFSNEGTQLLPARLKPVALLCIGCCLISSSVLLFLKSIWKACYKTSKIPSKKTAAFVLFFEFLVSFGAAVLTIVAMPHLDIVTNVTILNGVAVFSTILQGVTQCTAKERNRFLVPSIVAFCLIVTGFILFLVLYITKDVTDVRTITWAGLAVGGVFLVSFNWWETYFRLIGEKGRSVILWEISNDMRRAQNFLHILSSLLRIAVTACVLGAYVPLSEMDWDVVKSVPQRETRIIAITVGVQLISSALCHWFAIAACKMHALRRCFILPLYAASLAVMVLFIVPVIVYYQDFRISLNGTRSINFTSYCSENVVERQQIQNGTLFPNLVLDVTHTLCFLDMSKIIDIGLLTGSAVSWWLGLVLATLHLWFLKIYRIQRTQNLFVRRLYEGAFIEQSLLLNTRFDIQTKDRKKNFRELDMSMVYLCATMWHETYDEMMNIIISIFRLDQYRPKNNPKTKDFTFEAHIYFDDAFEDVGLDRHLNSYAENLVEVIKEVYGKEHHIPGQKILRTPYGGRLVITMPQGNAIMVHFKDKELIRHKKRWSQVMYFYYLLGYKLMSKYYSRWEKNKDDITLKAEAWVSPKKEKHNTYLLALDGDTDFQPTSVMLLIDRLKMYPLVGAACGRIHPTGSGPVVWFQKFEYAVSHWLQKTAEHVFGSVLCSPGCFSLFRAEALMDDNVMRKYCTKSTEGSHYVQYDQGEDRWLCTLLLKQGWRVEYNAASDAYTNAPEDFKELYNQRRRWGPSTMANIVDILGSSNIISKRNPSMSKLFMFYQLFALISSILAPATICLMIAGSLAFVFNMHAAGALVLGVIPPAIFLILCFKLKADTQIKIAGVLSIIYAFLMLVVMISIIGAMVKDQTILTPSSMFVVVMAIIYIITALMHPQEFPIVFYGFLYIICIPSAYLLLIIYSMVNMNNVSWGTRETKAATGPAKPKTYRSQRSSRGKVHRWNIIGNVSVMKNETVLNIFCISGKSQLFSTVRGNVSSDNFTENFSLSAVLQEEMEFWVELQEKYLKPLPDDKQKQQKVRNDLLELRNKISFVFFILNALWLVATFTLQILDASFSITLPKVDLDLQNTGEEVTIDPIGFMFILGFATSVVIQFFGMLYHRIYTLIHYVAFVDTVQQETKLEKMGLDLRGNKVFTTITVITNNSD